MGVDFDSISDFFINNPLNGIVGACITLILFVIFGRKTKNKKHQLKIKQGEKALVRIRQFSSQSQQIGYLRKINAYAFEELLLSALKEAGAKITRNKKYSGDGGLDGRCKYKGQVYFVQAKRYKNYISAEDVKQLSFTCRKKGVRGLFIHTGKTGKKSHEEKSNNVDIIDNHRLISLLIHKQLPT